MFIAVFRKESKSRFQINVEKLLAELFTKQGSELKKFTYRKIIFIEKLIRFLALTVRLNI